ncbi:hypothetical protein GXW82_38120 [Streptacidiphilus sp. 4-A2]|nr:hypothetical protein [Streptacidiphilus sp. 4-A2]
MFQAVEQLKVGFRPVAVAYIRPFGGGPEVETSPEMLREPTRDEVVSARVAAENRASRERLGGTSEKQGAGVRVVETRAGIAELAEPWRIPQRRAGLGVGAIELPATVTEFRDAGMSIRSPRPRDRAVSSREFWDFPGCVLSA